MFCFVANINSGAGDYETYQSDPNNQHKWCSDAVSYQCLTDDLQPLSSLSSKFLLLSFFVLFSEIRMFRCSVVSNRKKERTTDRVSKRHDSTDVVGRCWHHRSRLHHRKHGCLNATQHPASLGMSLQSGLCK